MDVTPILLFNEADAIFGRRFTDINHSADKMQNTVQNIILDELENFEGILIATTNFDKAFERRFLYKVKFDHPSKEVLVKLWMSFFPNLSEDEAKGLANRYSLSPGQMENISRKLMVDEILYSQNEDLFPMLNKFCKEEFFDEDKVKRRIGF